MSSACENPLCHKSGTKRCASCRAAFYCSAECGQKAWHTHRGACKFSLAEIPLPALPAAFPDVSNFPFQVMHAVDALELVTRVVPRVEAVELHSDGDGGGGGTVAGQAPPQPAFLCSKTIKIEHIAEKHDSLSESQRTLEIHVDDEDGAAVAGEDIFAALTKTGISASLVTRLSSLRKSLVFCTALLHVLETLAARKHYLLMHGREKLSGFNLARGHVRTQQPRLSLFKRADATFDTATQSAPVENEHYVLLLNPDNVFNEALVPDLARAVQSDKQAMVLDAVLRADREEFKRTYFGDEKGKSDACFVRTDNGKPDPLAVKRRDTAVFLAPAAGECDARLHKHRLFKGIPDWFFVYKVYTEKEMQAMQFADSALAQARTLAGQILVRLFGKAEAERLASAGDDAAASFAKEKK